MVGGTSGTEPRLATREQLNFGAITVVGGGCYGSYYVRQLKRAHAAGAMAWERLVVVDRNAQCQVASLADVERPPSLELHVAEWAQYFDAYLTSASGAPDAHERDAIVPSPLMPHLMAHWIIDRARRRWPDRQVVPQPLASPPDVPWQRAGDDGTHYVSFAEWMCPINCIEPARCPATKGERTWSMPPALLQYAARERESSRPVEGPFVFHCTHRAYGVGMIDVRDVLMADATIATEGAHRSLDVLIGTASHCHGALQRVVIG